MILDRRKSWGGMGGFPPKEIKIEKKKKKKKRSKKRWSSRCEVSRSQ